MVLRFPPRPKCQRGSMSPWRPMARRGHLGHRTRRATPTARGRTSCPAWRLAGTACTLLLVSLYEPWRPGVGGARSIARRGLARFAAGAPTHRGSENATARTCHLVAHCCDLNNSLLIDVLLSNVGSTAFWRSQVITGARQRAAGAEQKVGGTLLGAGCATSVSYPGPFTCAPVTAAISLLALCQGHDAAVAHRRRANEVKLCDGAVTHPRTYLRPCSGIVRCWRTALERAHRCPVAVRQRLTGENLGLRWRLRDKRARASARPTGSWRFAALCPTIWGALDVTCRPGGRMH